MKTERKKSDFYTGLIIKPPMFRYTSQSLKSLFDIMAVLRMDILVMLGILDENNIKYEESIVKIITPLGYAETAEYFKN